MSLIPCGTVVRRMFSRILDQMQEPFVAKASPLDSTDLASKSTKKITDYFGKLLRTPQLIPVTVNQDLSSKQLIPVNISAVSAATSAASGGSPIPLAINKPEISGDNIAAEQSKCEAVGSGDQFSHLTSLASTYNTQDKLRCGWVYNTQNPNNGRGAYGTIGGPFKTTATGNWMWNLDDAKQKFHTDICNQIKSCSDLDASQYKGRCGWCTQSGKAVPIVNGRLAYPSSPNTGCPASKLVASSATCPVPKAASSGSGSLAANTSNSPATICTPLANGNLSRNCIIQKVTSAGCNDKGTLVQALQSGSDNNYFSSLAQSKAYIEYQKRAVIGLNETALKTGKLTTSQALDEFGRVSDQASSQLNGGLQYAARDLCLKKGMMEEYDFCTEIKDSTPGPYPIECLQSEFLKAGGQESGTKFPNASTIKFWNSQSNWLNVKIAIRTLVANTKSADRGVQEDAMLELYGITLENKRKPLAICAGSTLPVNVNPTKGNILGKIMATEDYTLSFDITPRSTSGNWDSILHFTSDGDCCNPGNRVPGIWFVPGTYNLHVRVGDIGGDGNFGFYSVAGCSVGKTTSVKLECTGNQLTLTVGTNVEKLTQPHTRFSGPVTVYSGDPWYPAANCTIENLCYKGVNKPPPTDYTYKGCFNDNGNRALPIRLANVTNADSCYSQAQKAGLKTFGLQYYGECWAGNNDDWAKYGPKNSNECGNLGTAWNNQVYTLNKPPGPPPLDGISGVKIVMIAGGSTCLNISQVVVLNEQGQNISRGRPTAGSGQWDGSTPSSRAVDGNETPRPHPNEYHSSPQACSAAVSHWQVTLDTPSTVSSVTIYNRSDCCQDRLNSFNMHFFDSNRNLIYWKPNLGTAAVNILKTNSSTNRVSEAKNKGPNMFCYSARYPDLYSAFDTGFGPGNNQTALTNHFNTYGRNEGRNNQC